MSRPQPHAQRPSTASSSLDRKSLVTTGLLQGVAVTSPYVRFPDVQRVLVEALATFPSVTATGVETPADWNGQLPFVRVLRVGGQSGRLNDSPVVDVDVFAETYTAAEDLAEGLRQYLVGPPPPIVLFDRTDCEVGPREIPWGDGTVRRFNATYRITSRRRLV